MNKEIRDKKKAELIAYKGGMCHDCGGIFRRVCYSFDHRDPSAKSFGICDGMSKPMSELMAEVDKCDLVCHNCHAIRTEGDPRIAEKISAKGKGRIASRETRAKMSARRKDKPHPPNCKHCLAVYVRYHLISPEGEIFTAVGKKELANLCRLNKIGNQTVTKLLLHGVKPSNGSCVGWKAYTSPAFPS